MTLKQDRNFFQESFKRGQKRMKNIFSSILTKDKFHRLSQYRLPTKLQWHIFFIKSEIPYQATKSTFWIWEINNIIYFCAGFAKNSPKVLFLHKAEIYSGYHLIKQAHHPLYWSFWKRVFMEKGESRYFCH